jgi:diguanylate cyclase (GGDEF)-like protein/PAS domain S-box-containing protein
VDEVGNLVNDVAQPVAPPLESNTDHFRRLLDAAPVGAALIDVQAVEPTIVYASPGIRELTGLPLEELLAREHLLEQVRRGEPVQTQLRGRRKDGTALWLELTIVPLRDDQGVLTHSAVYVRDAGERPKGEAAARDLEARSAPNISRDDRLAGLYSLAFLDELLKRDWALAQREGRSVAVFAIDIDALELYNSTFGRGAGDSAIRRVAHGVAGCLRRASDVTARVDGGSFLAYASGLDTEQALRVGTAMNQRVRDLRIHHPRSTVLRYVSISVGVAVMLPEAADSPADLVQKARQQLDLVKKSGRNHAA